jgi:hypothetical protein
MIENPTTLCETSTRLCRGPRLKQHQRRSPDWGKSRNTWLLAIKHFKVAYFDSCKAGMSDVFPFVQMIQMSKVIG